MSNSTELKVKYHGKKNKPSRKKNPNVASVSKLGYRDDSPYRSLPYIDIHTPNGSIDMSGTGIPLWANGRILPPYSGIHQFDTQTVKEIPLAQTGLSTRDSVNVMGQKHIDLEQRIGLPGGYPNTAASMTGPYGMNKVIDYVANQGYGSAMNQAQVNSWLYNAGFDFNNNVQTINPKKFILGEYYRAHEPYKKEDWDENWGWKKRKNISDLEADKLYSELVSKLPEEEQQLLVNRAKDWFYKNRAGDTPHRGVNPDGSFVRGPYGDWSPDYEDVWAPFIKNQFEFGKLGDTPILTDEDKLVYPKDYNTYYRNQTVPKKQRKTGGLTKAQDGMEMPFGMPLKEVNPFTVAEYRQPMMGNFILPDPNRPELMNTGATEFKMDFDVDNGRSIRVPSVVSGQYIGPRGAIQRAMRTKEIFPNTADPSAYSKFYNMVNELGIMKQKKKGGWLDNYQPGGPIIFRDQDTQDQYDPVSDVIYLSKDRGDQSRIHEMYHKQQRDEGRLRDAEFDPYGEARRKPNMMEDQAFVDYPYYNRRLIEQQDITNQFLQANPEFLFADPDAVYNMEINPAMYETPWTAEGEARASESPEGRAWLESEGIAPIYKKGGLPKHQVPPGEVTPFVTSDLNEYNRRKQAYADSANVHNLQNQYNAEYLSNFNTTAIPNNKGIDLQKILELAKSRATIDNAKRTVNELLSLKFPEPVGSMRVIDPSQKLYQARVSRMEGPRVKPGHAVSNKAANDNNLVDLVVSDDNTDYKKGSKQKVLNPNTIVTSDYVMRPPGTRSTLLDAIGIGSGDPGVITYGYPHKSVVHATIKPSSYLMFHQRVPNSEGSLESAGMFDPSSILYDANQSVNATLPYFAMPVQEVIYEPKPQPSTDSSKPAPMKLMTPKGIMSIDVPDVSPQLITEWNGPTEQAPFVDYEGRRTFTAAGYPMIDTDRTSPTFGKTIRVPKGYIEGSKEEKEYRSKNTKKTGGSNNWLDQYQTGRELNLNIPNTAAASTTSVRKPVVVPVDPKVKLPMPPIRGVDFKDERVINPVTKKPIEDKKRRGLEGVPVENLKALVNQAKIVGIDPADLITTYLRETPYALTASQDEWKDYEEAGHVIYGNTTPTIEGLSPYDERANIVAQAIKSNLERGKRLYPEGPAYKQYQAYQGYGKLFPETEIDYYGEPVEGFFGLKFSEDMPFIDTKVWFPHGKTFLSERDSIVIPALDKYGIKYKKTGGPLPKAQTGLPGKFKKKMQDPTYGYGLQWFNDWYSNPETQKRLEQSGLDQEDMRYAFENLGNTQFAQTYPEVMSIIRRDLNKTYENPKRVNKFLGPIGEEILSTMPDVKGFALPADESFGLVYAEPQSLRKKDSVFPHELIHASTIDRDIANQIGANKAYITPKLKEFYPDLYKEAKKSGNKELINQMFENVGAPDEQSMFREIYPYVQSLRYELGVKPGETITEDILNKADQNKSLGKLLKMYSKPKLIQFMNTVAENKQSRMDMPMAKKGGLPKAQYGLIGPEEEQKPGVARVMGADEEGTPILRPTTGYYLPEVEISADAPDTYNNYIRNKYKDAGLGAVMFGMPMDYAFGFPQAAMTKAFTGKYQLPSEAMGIENPVGALLTDVVLDPINLVGAGLLTKEKALAALASSKESGLLSKAYKINPWAFKANPEAYYRQIGDQGLIDALESGVIRSADQSVFPRPHFVEGKDFSKLYSTGTGATGSKPSVIFETSGLNQAGDPFVFPANSTPGYTPWIASEVEVPLSQGKLLKSDWLRGYKEVPKQLPGSPNAINAVKNLEDLQAAQRFAQQYGYRLPDNLERIAQSNTLTDRTIRGLMDRHNTFVRGVSTNWEELAKRNPEILRHLEGKGFDLSTSEGTKAAAEYMATHIPIPTGYGRASLDAGVFNRGLDGLYTSNSIPTAEGYTYGQGFVVKAKRPTIFSSANRQDWITQNNPYYMDEDKFRELMFPLSEESADIVKSARVPAYEKNKKEVINIVKSKIDKAQKDITNLKEGKIQYSGESIEESIAKRNKTIESLNEDIKYLEKHGDDLLKKPGEFKILRTERSNLATDPFNFLFQKYGNVSDLSAFLKSHPYQEKMDEVRRLGESLTRYSWDEQIPIRDKMDVLSKEANKLYNDAIQDYMKMNHPDYDPVNKYAHYIHLGTPGEKVLQPIKSWEITPEIWKNKSRAHSNKYSKKFSAMATGGSKLPPHLPEAYKEGGWLKKYQPGGKTLKFADIPTEDKKKVVIDNFSKDYDYVVEGDKVYSSPKNANSWTDISANKKAQYNLLSFINKNNYWGGYGNAERNVFNALSTPAATPERPSMPTSDSENRVAVIRKGIDEFNKKEAQQMQIMAEKPTRLISAQDLRIQKAREAVAKEPSEKAQRQEFIDMQNKMAIDKQNEINFNKQREDYFKDAQQRLDLFSNKAIEERSKQLRKEILEQDLIDNGISLLKSGIKDAGELIDNSIEGWSNSLEELGQDINDLYTVGTRGVQRKLITYLGWGEEDDVQTRTDLPQTVYDYYSKANSSGSTISGIYDAPKQPGRQFKQQVLNTDAIKWGVRNRGDYRPFESDGMEVTAFQPFTRAAHKDNVTVLAVDPNGKMHTGQYKDFKNNQGWVWTPTFMNKVVDIPAGKDGRSYYKKSEKNPQYLQPVISVLDDKTNKSKQGSLNILVAPTKNEDFYGSVQGGRILFVNPKTKEKRLVSGSMRHIRDTFKKFKADAPYLEAYVLDNGTYVRGLAYDDKKFNAQRLRSYDNENLGGGGNGLYIMGYEGEDADVSKFPVKYNQTPNVRTVQDSSYITGHPVKNEVKNVVLHHTAYENPKTNEEEIKKQYMTPRRPTGKPGVGTQASAATSHVVIEEDGSRTIYASPEQVTFHAGKSEWNGRTNVNDFSIGVEFQGNTEKKPLTDAQIESFIEYYKPLAKRYNLTLKDIITHAMISPGRKPDIVTRDYERVLKRLKDLGYK